MARYTINVSVERLVTYTATVTVDAADEDEALRLADDAQESLDIHDEETSESAGGPYFTVVDVQPE